MRKVFAFVVAALVVSLLVAPTVFAAGPQVPPHPEGAAGVGGFLTALFAALAAFLGGIFG